MTDRDFNVAIIGLGLIGGSLAYALRGFRSCRLTGFDIDDNVLYRARQKGALDRCAGSLEEAVTGADLAIFCSSPHSVIQNMRYCLPFFKSGAVVTEICGVKRDILTFVETTFPDHLHYIGLHPMAGKEVSGFANAEGTLFRNAGFIIVPPASYHQQALELIEELAHYVGAGRVAVNGADEHDAIIAYTSDLMHIAATSLCHDFPANMTMAHTAAAFRDCTRIANVDATLWTELLLENAANIIPHLGRYIENLTNFQAALQSRDQEFIQQFLERATDHKKQIVKL